MSEVADVAIHSSQFPENIRRDLLKSLKLRQLNHKFLYESNRQTQKWLALHQAYSPSRTDPQCASIYDKAFAAAASQIRAGRVHLIGLGCGGGQKDSRLLHLLEQSGKEAFYTPSDVSTAMVLTAREAAKSIISAEKCFPLVCDLATADDSCDFLDRQPIANAARFISFFGMIPNFEPELILPRLGRLVRGGDTLLFSANLAPGPDYDAGMHRILPLYDNDLTRDWLSSFLVELGVEQDDGELRFCIEESASDKGLKRIAAYFHFQQPCQLQVDGHSINFSAGESMRLFFSYRHTPALVSALLETHGLRMFNQWITDSEEEGVFLCGRG